MANAWRLASGSDLEVLTTYKLIIDKSKQAADKLFMALFNIEFPERGTIEGRLKECRHHYESTCDAKFYKYIITKGEQQIKTDFKIEDTPTIIFFRNGAEIERIDNLEEADIGVSNVIKGSGETNDEKQVKERLDALCKKDVITCSDNIQQMTVQ